MADDAGTIGAVGRQPVDALRAGWQPGKTGTFITRDHLAGALCFAVGLAFIPGAALSPRWAILLIALPWLVAAAARSAGLVWLALLCAWSGFSLAWTPMLYDGVDALLRLACFAGAVWLGASLRSLLPALMSFAAAVLVNGVVMMAQLEGWTGIDARIHGPAGLFVNPHQLAELAALVVVGLAARRWWVTAAACLTPIALTTSRAAAVALVAGVAVNLSRRLRLALLGGGGALLTIAIAAGFRIASIEHRFALWRDTVEGLSLFGQGLGSWYGLYPLFALRTDTLIWREAHAHNDLLELAFDVGLVGALLAVGFVAVALRGRDLAARAVLVAFVVEGLFSFPLHMPCTALLAGLAAGRLCAADDGLRGGHARR